MLPSTAAARGWAVGDLGLNLSDLGRRAFIVYDLLARTVESGGKVVLENADGSQETVVFLELATMPPATAVAE